MIVYNTETQPNLLKIEKKNNDRYTNLNKPYHYFFTAGDYEQFVENIVLENTNPQIESSKYSVFETFEYIFHKFKKGCFLQIRENKLQTFIPFSKINYENNWSHLLDIDPAFGKDRNNLSRFKKMLEYINQGSKYEFYDINFQRNLDEWYGNNGLFRFEYPLQEYDSGYPMMYDMFHCLVKERNVSNVDFFLNKRDYPILKKNKTEPYHNLFGPSQPIEPKYQANFDHFIPILSMNSGSENLDLKIPTWQDWQFFEYQRNGKLFMEKKNQVCKKYPKVNDFFSDFDEKIPIAIFRGSSTGIGVTSKTNQRLFVCELSCSDENLDQDGIPFLDAKLSTFNRRPRKLMDDPFIRTIDIEKYKNLLGNEMNYVEQSQYKYVLHIPGHSCAYRLTIEMFFGSVILYFPFETELWYFHMLEPYVHYIPMKSFDKDSIFSTIDWCKKNNDKCREIARNAREFALRFLHSDYALDYVAKLVNNIATNYPICYHNQKDSNEKELKHYNELHLKSLDSFLSSLVKEYWIENYYFLQLLFRHLDNENHVESFLEQNCTQKNIVQSRNTIIDRFHFQGLDFIRKKIYRNYRRDDLQQVFIGYHFVNKLIHRFPNHFIHTIYHKEYDEKETHVFLEYKNGKTLFELLSNKQMSFENLIFVWIELCCVLQICQNFCSFVHNDLMTWNIMIKKLDKPTSIFFQEFNLGFVREYIPIIIDYGDCHMVYQNKSYYNTIPFHLSKSTDVIFMVFKSLENYINHSLTTEMYVKNLNPEAKQKKLYTLLRKQKMVDDIKKVLSFFSDVIENKSIFFRKYTIEDYTNSNNLKVSEDIWRIKTFLKKSSKYSILLERIEFYPEKNPIDFVFYLLQQNFVEKKNVFRRIVRKDQKYLQGFMTPYFNFFLRNDLLLKIMQDCENLIIMKNEINKFQKKVENQVKLYLKLLCEISGNHGITNSKNKLVFLFKPVYDEQFFRLANHMKEKFGSEIFLNDIQRFQIPVSLGLDRNQNTKQNQKIVLPIISFLPTKKKVKFIDENQIHSDLIENCYSSKTFDFFERRIQLEK